MGIKIVPTYNTYIHAINDTKTDNIETILWSIKRVCVLYSRVEIGLGRHTTMLHRPNVSEITVCRHIMLTYQCCEDQ